MDKLHEQLERLHAQYDEISDDDDDDDDTQADATAKAIATLESQLEALQQQQDAITQAQEFVSPEVAALAGAVVYIDANGQVHVERNRVRLADARAATRAATKAGADAAGAGAGGATHATDHKGAVSDKLCRQLTAHRTRALQAALLGNECVALAALVHPLLTRLVTDMRATWHSPSVLQVTTQYCETQLQACAPD